MKHTVLRASTSLNECNHRPTAESAIASNERRSVCQGARVPERGRRSKKSDDRWENATKRLPHNGSIVRGSRLAKAASGLRLA